MKLSLLKDLNEKDKLEMKGLFIQSSRLRAQIIKLLNEKYESEDRSTLTKDRYADASWGYRQADSIGYKRAISEIISLLEN